MRGSVPQHYYAVRLSHSFSLCFLSLSLFFITAAIVPPSTLPPHSPCNLSTVTLRLPAQTCNRVRVFFLIYLLRCCFRNASSFALRLTLYFCQAWVLGKMSESVIFSLKHFFLQPVVYVFLRQLPLSKLSLIFI